MNSFNYRRVVDEPSLDSNQFTRDRHQNWSEDNLSSYLPETWQEDSAQLSSSGTLRRLVIRVQRTRLAVRLDGCVTLLAHNFERALGSTGYTLKGYEPREEFMPQGASLRSVALRRVLQEQQVTKWQKN